MTRPGVHEAGPHDALSAIALPAIYVPPMLLDVTP